MFSTTERFSSHLGRGQGAAMWFGLDLSDYGGIQHVSMGSSSQGNRRLD